MGRRGHQVRLRPGRPGLHWRLGGSCRVRLECHLSLGHLRGDRHRSHHRGHPRQYPPGRG